MDRLTPDTWRNVKKSFCALKWYDWLMAAVMVLIAAWAMVQAFADPAAGGNPPWLTAVNFVSAVAGIFCVFFCAGASVSNFFFGLINTAAYIVYLWYWHIWGTMCLELFVYLPMGVIGWINWAGHRDEKQKERAKARRMNLRQNVLTAFGILAATVVYRNILVSVGGEVVWLDAATVAIGIVATVLQSFRFREQYVWWLVTDVVAVAMYIQHFDPVYLTKKSIYLIVAIMGLINWVKLSRQNGENR